MKIVCVLISYILVTVLADVMEQYLKNFHFINLHMEIASTISLGYDNALEYDIKETIIIDRVTMEQLNLLFGVSVELIMKNTKAAAKLQSKFLSKLKSRPMHVPAVRTSVLDLKELAQTRRNITGEAVERLLKRSHEEITAAPTYTCCLIALYKNTKFRSNDSEEYITSVEVDNTDLCSLMSTSEDSITYYRYDGNQIFQVWPNDSSRRESLFGEPSVDLDTRSQHTSRNSRRIQISNDVTEIQNQNQGSVTSCRCSVQ